MDANQRSFIGALAAAIKAFCMLFINAVNVADNAVAMADKAVKVARKRQAIDLGVSMNDYATKSREAAVHQQVRGELAMREFINNDPVKQALVEEARKNIDAIIKQELAEIAAEEASNQ